MAFVPILVGLPGTAPIPQSIPQAVQPIPERQARLKLTTPFPVRLGSVGPREVREMRFGVRSLADRPFHFRLLDTSPGLSLDPSQLAEPMRPGEVRTLRVRVDPSGMAGPIKGAVRLGTDDPGQPTYVLRYDMTVRPEVVVDGVRKSLGEVAPHESPDIRFRFNREGGDPLRLTLTSDIPPHLEVELAQEGVTADLQIRLRPARLKAGVTAGLEVFKVETNASLQPTFILYMDWRLALPVIPDPARVVFTDEKTTLLALELRSRDGKPFRILRVEIQGKGFQLLDAPGPEASRHVLRIRRRGTSQEAMLVLTCSNLDAPLQVPLRYLDPRLRPVKSAPIQPQSVAQPHPH